MADSIFRAEDSAALVRRVLSLSSSSRPLWGKLDVGRMLAHCQRPLRVATGELELQRGLLGMLLGGLAKKKLLADAPFARNMPTDKHFVVREPCDFTREQAALIALLQHLNAVGPAGLTRAPHPFFGPLTSEEWDRLLWKHLDHHLRQFGA